MIDYGLGVALDRIEKADLGRLRDWRNQEPVRKWCRQTDLISEVDQESWYQRQASDPSIQMYMILTEGRVNRSEPAKIGVCGLTSLDLVNRRAEFSLYVAPRWHGNGYGRMALATLLNHGFDAYGLNSIWGETFDGNPAAELFESLGFEKEGTRRQFYFKGGRYVDAHLYSILRGDWRRVLYPRGKVRARTDDYDESERDSSGNRPARVSEAKEVKAQGQDRRRRLAG